MTAPSPSSWDEDAMADDDDYTEWRPAYDATREGCATPEVADTMADDDVTDSPGFGGGQGRMPSEIADTGGAMVGCLGWAALVFAAAVLWLIYASVTG